MPDDGQIKVGLSIDTTGLSAAQSRAQASADQIAAAYQKVAAAALEAQNVQSRHRDIIKQYQVGAIDAATSTKLLAQNLAENAAAASVAAGAEKELVSALAATAAGENAVTAAIGRGISARQSATASISIMEGRMMGGNRAAAAFLSTTLGLGPALQAAFPVIGAAALGMVLVQITDAIIKFAERANELSDTLGTGWLEAAGLELTGFGEKVKEQEKELEKFQHEIDGFVSKGKEQQLAIVGLKEGPVAEYSARAAAYQQEATRLDLLLPRMKERLAVEQAIANSQYLKQITSDPMMAAIAAHAPDVTGLGGINANPALAGEQARVQQAEITATIKQIDNLRTAAQEAALQASKAGTPEKEKTPKESPEVRDYYRNRTKDLEAYTRRIEEDTKKQEEILDRSMNAQLEEQKFVTTQEIADANTVMVTRTDTSKKVEEIDQHRAEEYKRNHEEQMRMLQEQTEAALKSATQQEEEANRIIAFREKMKTVTPRQAEQERLAVSYAAEQAQLGPLEAEKAQYHPAEGADQAAQYQKIQDQITAVQTKAAAQREQIVQQEAEREMQTYMKYADQTNQALIGGLNEWMTTHKSFTDSMIDAGKHWAVSMIDDIAQVMLKKLEMWALDKIIGSDTGNKASAAQIANNASEAESAAGTAAAIAAMEAAPGGIGAALAAGAEMYAAMMPWVLAASMDTGGMVPGRAGQPIPILAHGGEEVVQGPVAQMVARANQGGGTFGGGHTFNTHSTINATVMDTRGLEGLARRSADANALHLKRAARRMNITI